MHVFKKPWPSRTPLQYAALEEDECWNAEEKAEGGDELLQPPSRQLYKSGRRQKYLLWSSWFANAVLAFILLAIITFPRSPTSYSFDTGYRTELALAPARQYIEIEEKRFDGTGEYDENGNMVLRGKDAMQYVGEPSPEIDEAWEKLTTNRYFMLSETEARQAWPNDDIQEFWDPVNGGYVAGLDVFHVLHCVGQVRQSYYPEYYGTKGHVHSWHCLEAIRQYIMCNADLTPIPTRFYTSRNTTYIESDLVHTCRNFDRLQDFLQERRTGPSAVMPLYHPYSSEPVEESHHGHGS